MTNSFGQFPAAPEEPAGSFPSDGLVPAGSVPWPGEDQGGSPATDGRPPESPEGRRRRTQVIAGVSGLVAVVLALVAGIGMATGSGSTPKGRSSAAQASTDAPAASISSSEETSHSVEVAPPSVVAPSAATLPTFSADINVDAVRDEPHMPEVGRLLDKYFSGINAHDGAQAASVFSTDGSVNPHSARAVKSFQHQIHTTHDDKIVVVSIVPEDIGSHTGLLVHATFRSRQAAAYGPRGSTCTDWNLDYEMPYIGGSLQLKDSVNVVNVDCA